MVFFISCNLLTCCPKTVPTGVILLWDTGNSNLRSGILYGGRSINLNNISCLENVPIFETPELPKAERIRLFKYLYKIRTEIHRDAVQRILRKCKFIGKVAKPILANSVIERLFYRSRFWRKS